MGARGVHPLLPECLGGSGVARLWLNCGHGVGVRWEAGPIQADRNNTLFISSNPFCPLPFICPQLQGDGQCHWPRVSALSHSLRLVPIDVPLVPFAPIAGGFVPIARSSVPIACCFAPITLVFRHHCMLLCPHCRELCPHGMGLCPHGTVLCSRCISASSPLHGAFPLLH